MLQLMANILHDPQIDGFWPSFSQSSEFLVDFVIVSSSFVEFVILLEFLLIRGLFLFLEWFLGDYARVTEL